MVIIFQNYIQHNKDWKRYHWCRYSWISRFQNYIQHNKDWKYSDDQFLPDGSVTSRTTSSTTRIERYSCLSAAFLSPFFQNYIQHNKDWKFQPRWLILHPWWLPELHPAQQGLKDPCLVIGNCSIVSSRTTSSTTRIESYIVSSGCSLYAVFQNYIQHNKDWKKKSNENMAAPIVFQNYIQHNKDWKYNGDCKSNTKGGSSRTTSSTTRIESRNRHDYHTD